MTPVIRQQNPVGTGFVVAARWVDVLAVSAVSANYTVPANVSLLRLTPTTAALPAYGNLNAAAAVPAATTVGAGSFPVPAGLMVAVRPGDVLALVGAAAGFVSIEAWT